MVNLQRKNGFGSSTVQEFLQLCKSLEFKAESFILLINLCHKAQRQLQVLVSPYNYIIAFKVGNENFLLVTIEKSLVYILCTLEVVLNRIPKINNWCLGEQIIMNSYIYCLCKVV